MRDDVWSDAEVTTEEMAEDEWSLLGILGDRAARVRRVIAANWYTFLHGLVSLWFSGTWVGGLLQLWFFGLELYISLLWGLGKTF